MVSDKTEKLFLSNLIEDSLKKINVNDNIIKLEKLTGDASTRRYFRVQTDDKSYVACLCDNDTTLDDFLNVQKVLDKNDVSVPEVYDSSVKNGYLLQEDLGNITLLKRNSYITGVDEEYKLYKKAIDELLKIHKINYQTIGSNFVNRSFDYEKLTFETSFTKKFFLESYLGLTLGGNDQKILDSTFETLCLSLANLSFVLTHRDFHSRNIMVGDKDSFNIIDFQDARLGIPQYDLASLLDDCYYQLHEENVHKLKKYYWESMNSSSHYPFDFDKFCLEYDQIKIQRTYKAIGSFSYIYETRNDNRYLKYIGFSFEKLRSVLMKYPEYDDLRNLLASYFYEH